MIHLNRSKKDPDSTSPRRAWILERSENSPIAAHAVLGVIPAKVVDR
jgi:hypothetical protein